VGLITFSLRKYLF